MIEPYLIRVVSKKYRLALAKFTCGVAHLHIETGWYRNIPEKSSVCFQYLDKIENELHVIIQSERYTDLRVQLFESATIICPDFLNMSDSDKLCFPLSNDKICIDVARTLHDIFEKRRQVFLWLNILILLCGICIVLENWYITKFSEMFCMFIF